MKLKLNKKLFLLAATSTLTLSGCGLNSEYDYLPYEVEYVNEIPENKNLGSTMVSYSEVLEKMLPDNEIVEEPSVIVSDGEYVKATTNVNIRSEANTNSNRLCVLGLGASAKVIGEENGFYKVEYLDYVGYVSKDFVSPYHKEHVNLDPIDVAYFPKETLIYDEGMEGKSIAPAGEFSFVYEDQGDMVLVDVDGIVGYVDKTQVQHIDDVNNYVVVDISDQNVKVLNGCDVLVDSPCVTGAPSSPTQTGLFTVWRDKGMRYLGCDNSPWVNVMKSFDGNRGLHDAERYTEENGFKHGWRDASEFVPTTYLVNGSHGCVNMPHDEAMELDQLITKESKVLVKR